MDGKSVRSVQILSEFFSLLGLSQNHAHAVSDKYVEATRLNSEFELNLHNGINVLSSELVHFRHKVSAIAENENDTEMLMGQIESVIETFTSECKTALKTAENTKETLAKASRFTSIKQWDECLALLHSQVSASKHQLERINGALGQFHRVLDNAVPSENFAIIVEPNLTRK